jgi:hypothetical protein
MIEHEKDSRIEMIQIALLALCVGIIQHILFYNQEIGISYPIFVGVLYAYIFWGLRHQVRRGMDLEFMLLVPIILLSLTFFMFANVFLQLLNFLLIPLLIVAQTIRMGEVKRHSWHTVRYIGDLCKQITVFTLSYLPQPFLLITNVMREKTRNSHNKTLLKVSFGLLLTLPLLLVVVPLLASADSIFKHNISGLQELLLSINLGSFLFRMIWILLVSSYLFSYLWAILYPRMILTKETPKGEPLKLDTTVALTVLVVVNAVYLLFTLVQFSYFFAAGHGILPDNTNYAEYARRGFAELILVTMINFSLLMGGIHWVQTVGYRISIFLKTMLTLLVGSTMVMLISAFLRLSLYEEAYGYTSTRILVHAFMIFLGVLLVLSLIRVWVDSLPLLKQFIIVTLVSWILLNFSTIDVIITKNNLQRYTLSGKIDMAYIGSLSYDSIPTLVDYYDNTSNKPVGLKELLLNKKSELSNKEQGWQAFNLAQYRAMEALKHVK